jgi:hypothetical protein
VHPTLPWKAAELSKFAAVSFSIFSPVAFLSHFLWDMDCTAHSGLAAMPCAIHLSLQRQGIVPKSALKTLYDYVILVFCAGVMVVGCLMAVKEIIQGH